MIISTYGSRFYGGQIDRIDVALNQLGHNVSHSDDVLPDFIYSNDASHYDEAIYRTAHYIDSHKQPKLILNILDVPHWLPNWLQIKKEWSKKLWMADKVTCISQTVQKDVKNYLNIDADVIYNPIKSVSPLGLNRDILCLFVGRCNAPNKRVQKNLYPLYKSLITYWDTNCMHFVGSENSGFGVNHGIVSDEELNNLYNRSMFTLISSSYEGLNLPMIEGIICNSKPIICRDMSTALELGIPELLCDPTPQSMFYKMKEVCENIDEYDKICFPWTQKYSLQFSPKSIAENIISVYDSI